MKRVRQNEKRRLRNRHVMSNLRTQVKKVRVALESGDAQAAQSALPTAISALSRAATKGVLHKNTADRRIGRLMRAVSRIQG